MPNYVVVVEDSKPPLAELVQGAFPESYQIAPNSWVVRTELSTQELSEAIFPRGDDGQAAYSHLVARFDAHWGFHDRAFWEWLS